MKIFTIVSISLLPFCSLRAAPEKEIENKAEEKVKTYQSLSEEFYVCVTLPGHMVLTIKDEETLAKGLLKIKESQKRITEIAAELEKMPLPTEAEKKVVSDQMNEKEERLEVEYKDKFIQHLKEMPAPLMDKLAPVMNEFYESLDAHSDVFDRYFKTKEELEEDAARKAKK